MWFSGEVTTPHCTRFPHAVHCDSTPLAPNSCCSSSCWYSSGHRDMWSRQPLSEWGVLCSSSWSYQRLYVFLGVLFDKYLNHMLCQIAVSSNLCTSIAFTHVNCEGYGPTYCGTSNLTACISNCDAKAACGPNAEAANFSCPLV